MPVRGINIGALPWGSGGGLDVDLLDGKNASELLVSPYYFKSSGYFEVKDERANQGVAVDADGNFYVFSHDATPYGNTITKYDSDWNYVSEALNQAEGLGENWVFSDGSVIDGKLYIALRERTYAKSAIGIWDLNLNYESIHETEGGCAEEIQKHDGYYWIIQGSHGAKPHTIAKYSTGWVYQATYDLAYGYGGFEWVGDQVYCNRTGSVLDIYDFDGSTFTRVQTGIKSLGDEGFCVSGNTFYFAGVENNTVWVGTLEKDETDEHINNPNIHHQQFLPAARAYLANPVSNITDATVITVPLDTLSYAYGAWFDVTNSHAFRVPTTGLYLVNAAIAYGNAKADHLFEAKIYQNSVTVSMSYVHSSITQSMTCNINDILPFNAGDSIYLKAYVSVGDNSVDILGGSFKTFMSIALISKKEM